MIEAGSEWLDRDGLLKSHASWEDASGDGIVFSVVGGLLKVMPIELVDAAVYQCIDPTTGLLHRRPDGTGGQTSHDSWAALAVWLLYRGDSLRARGLLVSALFRGFYLKNAPLELEGKSWREKIERIAAPWMGRFPRIWIVLLLASAPQCAFVRLPCLVLIRLMTSGYMVNFSDASSLQLHFLDLMSLYIVGQRQPMVSYLRQLRDLGSPIATAMSKDPDPYWDASHPVISGYRHFEQEMLDA